MSALGRLLRSLPPYYLASTTSPSDLPPGSPLGAILGAIATQGLDVLAAQRVLAKQTLAIVGATGSWVDFLANLYGIPPRFPGETDAALVRRVLNVLLPGTIANLQTMLQPYSTVTPVIFEPMGGTMVGNTFAGWQQSQTTINGTFTRGTTAVDPATGDVVAENTPIYDPGLYSDAILMWEGTTNLLTAEQASFESGTLTGVTALESATLAQSTAEHWTGSASLEVTTPGAVTGEGFYVALGSGAADTQYNGSAWVMGSGTVQLRLYDATNTLQGSPQEVTLTGAWQRVQDLHITLGLASTDLELQVATYGSAQAVTFYADGCQIEQKAYSTPWYTGGATRDADALTLATPSGLSVTGGTIQGWYLGGQDWYTVAANAGLWESNPGVTGSLQFQETPTGVSWGIYGGSAATWDYPEYAFGYTDAWHFLSATWRAITGGGWLLTLFADGVQVAQATSTQGPTFAANLTYGACAGYAANGLLEDWQLLDYALPPAGVESSYGMSGPLQPTANTLALFGFDQSIAATVGGYYEGVAFYLRVGIVPPGGSATAGYFLDNSYFDQSYLTDTGIANPAIAEVQAILAQKLPAGIKALVQIGGI